MNPLEQEDVVYLDEEVIQQMDLSQDGEEDDFQTLNESEMNDQDAALYTD